MIRFVLFALLFAAQSGWAQSEKAGWIDSSHEVFLPASLGKTAAGFRDYPLFWWNFVVVDKTPESDITQVCERLDIHWQTDILKLPCAMSAKDVEQLTRDWLEDTPRRAPLPSDLEKKMALAMTKASLPLPEGFLKLLRKDPLNALGELNKQVSERVRFREPMKQGMIFDPAGTRVMIPVQFSFAPSSNERTRVLNNRLKEMCSGIPGCEKISLYGPHAGALENEDRIHMDLKSVSIAGILGALLLAGFIFMTGRWRLVLLLPILGVGVFLAAVMTAILFGSIHGITLAFGPGIIGLALDYGVHAVFLDPRSKATWRSNLAGLLTTLAILIILIFSQVPLLRQLMVFSVLGLCLSFLLFFVILRRWPQIFITQAYAFTPGSWRPGEWVALALVCLSPLVFFNGVELGVQKMNYESARTLETRKWFVETAGLNNPFWINENENDALTSSHLTRQWAEANGFEYEGLAAYLPTTEIQTTNLLSWRELLCPQRSRKFSPEAERFFQPFFAGTNCEKLIPRDLGSEPPAYAADFASRGRWVSLLFPKEGAQVEALKKQFPGAHTPREMFEAFPRVFLFELGWMVPLALIAALAFLWRHFRSKQETFYAVVPFLAGLGCYGLTALVLSQPLSFISLIGLLMVFGFSLDYGIFVVDLLKSRNEGAHGVWSALSVCSFSTLLGFAPLMFAEHPVLFDLGLTLFCGSLGTYLGTFWGIPKLYRKARA